MGIKKRRFTVAGGCLAVSDTKNGPRKPLGNTPGVTITVEQEEIEAKDAKDGIRVTADKTTIDKSAICNVTVNESFPETLKFFFLSTDVTNENQAAATGQTVTITASELDCLYPLGKKRVSITSVTNTTQGGAVLTEGTDYSIDKPGVKHGQIMICSSANIAINDELEVTFDCEEVVVEKMDALNTGQVQKYLHFFGSSVRGTDQSFVGLATLAPDGEYGLVTDGEYQSYALNCEFLLTPDVAGGTGLFEYEGMEVS